MSSILDKIDVSEILNRVLLFLPSLVAAIGVMLAFWVTFRLTRGSLRALLNRSGLHETLVRMLVDNVYKAVLFAFGLVMALDQLGINVAAALAGLGVAGITIGFAAQDSISNIFAGFVIFMDKPFEVSDWITVGGEYGRVQNITMRSTRIRTNQNTYVVIPNRKIIDETLVNHSKHGETRIDIPVGIAYKENIPEARRVMLEAVRGLEGVSTDHKPDVVAKGLGSSSVDLLVRVWIDDASLEQPVFFRVLEACKLALDGAGIQIPFPHLQLFVDDVEERVVEKLAGVRGG